MAPAPLPPTPNRSVPNSHSSAMTAPAPAGRTQLVTADAYAASGVRDALGQAAAAPQPKKSFTIAKAAPQTITPSVTPAAPQTQPKQNNEAFSSSSPSSLTTQQALQMNLPTDGVSPPLPLVTGTPELVAGAPVPAGVHLEDGDYVSDKHEFEWGDLRVKISVHGGLITGVEVLRFPDHRSQSLYLSQMAIPILESEVIKSQKSQVDVVSSATDTSYAFQDTVANAIIKATRG
jgi:uncharacterized protein with FMN-binding domain